MCLRPNSHITLKNMYVLGKISLHEISPKKIKKISSGASGVSVIDMIQVQGLLPDRYEAQVSGWVPQTAIDILVRIRRLHHQWPFRWMWRILALQTSRSFATNFLKGKWGWKNSIPNSCAWHLRTWITLHFTSKHQRSCLHLFTKWPNRCDLKCLSWETVNQMHHWVSFVMNRITWYWFAVSIWAGVDPLELYMGKKPMIHHQWKETTSMTYASPWEYQLWPDYFRLSPIPGNNGNWKSGLSGTLHIPQRTQMWRWHLAS